MKRVAMLAAALLILIATPAMALTQDEAQQIANDAGCNVPVVIYTWPTIPDWNAFYGQPSPWWPVQIGLVNMQELPESWQQLILYHEIGHCLQGGGEWEADKYAIRMMADRGLDGSAIMHDMWAWESNRSEYLGSAGSSHGLFTHRITRGWLNRWFPTHEGA